MQAAGVRSDDDPATVPPDDPTTVRSDDQARPTLDPQSHRTSALGVVASRGWPRGSRAAGSGAAADVRRLSTEWRFPLSAGLPAWQAAPASPAPQRREPPLPTLEPISISYGGLLTRLDILVTLVADRRGLALDLHGRLSAAEARLLTEALELDRQPGPAS